MKPKVIQPHKCKSEVVSVTTLRISYYPPIDSVRYLYACMLCHRRMGEKTIEKKRIW